ncbi:MAG: hypothetical protein HOQ24_00835 [Mycobacteriaceae bacterium]|nr:hypothetical protein [Mycobacteriaceae bacterium]
MEPVEINAGRWYLRALRSDERVDDRPALADGGITDPDYIARRSAGWADETALSWAVCEPTTGELLAEIVLIPGPDGTAALTGWSRPGYSEVFTESAPTVRRFAEAALGYTLTSEPV